MRFCELLSILFLIKILHNLRLAYMSAYLAFTFHLTTAVNLGWPNGVRESKMRKDDVQIEKQRVSVQHNNIRSPSQNTKFSNFII